MQLQGRKVRCMCNFGRYCLITHPLYKLCQVIISSIGFVCLFVRFQAISYFNQDWLWIQNSPLSCLGFFEYLGLQVWAAMLALPPQAPKSLRVLDLVNSCMCVWIREAKDYYKSICISVHSRWLPCALSLSLHGSVFPLVILQTFFMNWKINL